MDCHCMTNLVHDNISKTCESHSIIDSDHHSCVKQVILPRKKEIVKPMIASGKGITARKSKDDPVQVQTEVNNIILKLSS